MVHFTFYVRKGGKLELSWENKDPVMVRPEFAASKICVPLLCWCLIKDLSDFRRGSDSWVLNNLRFVFDIVAVKASSWEQILFFKKDE